jgi:DNA polymerase I-like protein with 3'-5' exonuclease and polymerase domains
MGEGYNTTIDECKVIFYKYKETFKTAVAWLDSNKRKAREELAMSNIIGRRRRWIKPNYGKIKADLEKEMMKKFKGKEFTPEMEYQLHKLTKEKESGIYSGIEREGANFMVQSTNVEFTKDAMYEIRKQCKKRGYDARMYNSVYDEIVLDVAKKDAEAVYALQCKIMIESGQKYCSRVPVEVEGHLAECWTK